MWQFLVHEIISPLKIFAKSLFVIGDIKLRWYMNMGRIELLYTYKVYQDI